MFICVEGVDFSGKSTFVTHLKHRLETQYGRPVTQVRFPCDMDKHIPYRKLLLEKKHSAPEDLLLFLANIVAVVQTEVIPALNRGDIVIADRSILSTMVYQCPFTTSAYDRFLKMFDLYLSLYPKIETVLMKTFYIILDVDTGILVKRRAERGVLDSRDITTESEFYSKKRMYRVAGSIISNKAILVSPTYDHSSPEIDVVQYLEKRGYLESPPRTRIQDCMHQISNWCFRKHAVISEI